MGSESEEDKDENYSTLRELLIRPAHKSNGSRASSPDQPGSPTAEEGSNSSSKGAKRQRIENNEEVRLSLLPSSTSRSLIHNSSKYSE